MAAWPGPHVLGQVYKDVRDGEWAAVKKIPGDDVTQDKMNTHYETYTCLSHPNVERIVARPLRHWDHMWHIPMEFIFGEKLQKIMFHPRRSSIQLAPVTTSRVITGMCEGLLYLHNNGIVHQDINPENIMVDGENYRAVIIGVFNHEGLYAAKNKRSPHYAAPEIRDSAHATGDQSSDVWALGKVIIELLVGYHMSLPEVKAETIKYGLRGNVYQDVVHWMLESSPEQRATMESVISEIRAAERKVQDTHSLSAPSSSLALPSHTLQPLSNSEDSLFGQIYGRIRQDLPPGVTLPNPLPPNHKVSLNYATHDTRGREVGIRGELRTRHGRIHDVWWTKCEPNDSDDDDGLLYLE